LSLLDTVTVRKERLHDEIKANIKLIEGTLASFDVEATVIGVNSGPSVTQYELQPGHGVPVRKITALQNDLALALSAAIRIQAPPEELKYILIDPKRVEFSMFQDMPHLLVPVVTESDHATSALRWAVAEMETRYKLFASHTVRNIADFNGRAPDMGLNPLPYIVIVIDELADLMMVAAGEIEELICRIAQLARAVGIHLL